MPSVWFFLCCDLPFAQVLFFSSCRPLDIKQTFIKFVFGGFFYEIISSTNVCQLGKGNHLRIHECRLSYPIYLTIFAGIVKIYYLPTANWSSFTSHLIPYLLMCKMSAQKEEEKKNLLHSHCDPKNFTTEHQTVKKIMFNMILLKKMHIEFQL